MIYEKPEISFQKFHTEAFLDDMEDLSINNPDDEHFVYDPDEGFTFDSAGFNGTISIRSDGVGGWFNG